MLSFNSSDYHRPRGDHYLPNVLDVWSDGKAVLPSPVPCEHCQHPVSHLAHLWICHSCGHSLCPRCPSHSPSHCPSCKSPSRVLNLPATGKTQAGLSLLRDASVGLFIRISAHAVSSDAAAAFLKANRLLQKNPSEALAEYSYAVKSLLWISGATPEYHHACGHDADLVRVAAARARLQQAGSEQALVDAAPELFFNQSIIPVDEDALIKKHGVSKRRRRPVITPVKSLFVDWNIVGEDIEGNNANDSTKSSSSECWERRGSIEALKDGGGDDLFQHLHGVLWASERWDKGPVTLSDHRIVFPSSVQASRFLAYRYQHLGDGLPVLHNALSCGTDCVARGGMGYLPDGAGHVVFNYAFREQNVVVKMTYSKRGPRGALKEVLTSMFNRTRVAAYSHAQVVQQLLQRHPVTDLSKSETFFSRFINYAKSQ